MKFMKEFLEYFSSKPTFSSDEARNFFSFRQGPGGYYKTVINNLIKSGRIYRITRGHYSFFDEVQFTGFAYKPFYYGLQDALSLLDLWEQETNPVIITPRKVRNGTRVFNDRNYVVRRIDRKMFFGYSLIKYGDFYIPVSDSEKTLIDMTYYHEYIPEETKLALIDSIKPQIFHEYCSRLSPILKKRVLSVIEDLPDISEDFRRKLVDRDCWVFPCIMWQACFFAGGLKKLHGIETEFCSNLRQ